MEHESGPVTVFAPLPGPDPLTWTSKEGLAMNATRNMPEEWRPVVGHEGLYEVSNLGGVKSLPRVIEKKNGTKQTIRGGLLKFSTTPSGHKFCHLWKNNERNNAYVHRLVAVAFLGEVPDGKEVCHNDGNPENNQADNLRYDTRSGNMLDEVRSRRHWQSAKTHCKRGHEFTPENTLFSGIKRVQRVCRTCKARRHDRG